MDSILDAERSWSEFLNRVLGPFPEDDRDRRRYIRINPNLGERVPALDEKDKLKDLQDMTEKCLNLEENRVTIRRIDHRLIATSFYFEVEKLEALHSEDDFHCSGLLVPCFLRSEVSGLTRVQVTSDADLQTVRNTSENLVNYSRPRNTQGLRIIVHSSWL
jgi:hypothetical protein